MVEGWGGFIWGGCDRYFGVNRNCMVVFVFWFVILCLIMFWVWW